MINDGIVISPLAVFPLVNLTVPCVEVDGSLVISYVIPFSSIVSPIEAELSSTVFNCFTSSLILSVKTSLFSKFVAFSCIAKTIGLCVHIIVAINTADAAFCFNFIFMLLCMLLI